MKRALAIMISLCMATMALAGCGGGSPQNTETDAQTQNTTQDTAEADPKTDQTGGTFRIGYANSGDTDVFDKMKRDEFEKATKDDSAMEVTFTEANMDVQKQLDQVDNFIAQQMDLIIIVPVDYAGIEPAVTAANKANIPVICLGIESSGGDFIFVGCQNRDAGVMQAEYMAEHLPENAGVLYLSGTPGLYHSVEREEGFTETIHEKRPDIKILASQTGEYTRAKGQQITEDWIQAFPEFNAVVAANDQMALGATEALKGANRLEGVSVGGVDAVADACNSIQAGEMSMSVLQSAPELAKACYETAQKIQAGQDVETRIIVPFQLVTKDNVDEFLAN